MSEWREENFFKYANCIKTGCSEYSGIKKYYSTGSIQNEKNMAEGNYSYTDRPSRANRLVFKNDVLQARMKSTNKAILVDGDMDASLFSTGFIQSRPMPNACYPKYIYYFVQSDLFLMQRDEYSTGSTQEALTDTGLKKIKIPVPSTIEEQKQIVERLEARLEKLNNARQKLEKIPLVLKRFRQSVLASACNGRLTASWREGKGFAEWEETTMLNVVSPNGKIFDGPFGSNLKTSDYTEHGVRVVRLENIGALNFFHNKETYISEEKYLTLKKHEVFEDDIIFSSFIVNNIRVCTLPKFETKAIAKADCFCIRPNKVKANKTFLCYVLSSPKIYDTLLNLVHGATRPRINTTQLKHVALSLPPLTEQEEIVRRVDKLFAIADSIESRYNNIKTKLDKAEKSLYAKAFRGEL